MSVPLNKRAKSNYEVFKVMSETVREIFHCVASEDVMPKKTRWQFGREICNHAMSSYILLSEATEPAIRDINTKEKIKQYERDCIDEWYTLIQILEIYSGMYATFPDRYYNLVEQCSYVYCLLVQFFIGEEYDEYLYSLNGIPVLDPLPILNHSNITNRWQ